jgi:Flp pilus assembly protein TadD
MSRFMAARLVFFAAIIFTAFFFTAFLAAAQEVGSIIGMIRISRGEFPSDRIMVGLQGRGAPLGSTYTDDQGRFSFSGLPTNPYHVVINDSRYMPIDEMVIVNPKISPQTIIQINLVPKELPKQEGAKTAGSNPYTISPTTLVKSYPKEATREFDRGVKADKDGQVDEAIRHYERAIKAAADFYPARNNLGTDYMKKAQLDAAKEQFDQAMRLNPNDAEAYFNMANLLLLTKSTDAAVQQARAGLTKQPNSAFGQFVLGSALDSSGNPAEAESALHRAVELDPSLSKAHLALVNIYLRAHRNNDAVAELKAFLHASPNDPLAPKATELLKKLDQGSAQRN